MSKKIQTLVNEINRKGGISEQAKEAINELNVLQETMSEALADIDEKKATDEDVTDAEEVYNEAKEYYEEQRDKVMSMLTAELNEIKAKEKTNNNQSPNPPKPAAQDTDNKEPKKISFGAIALGVGLAALAFFGVNVMRK